MVIHKQPIISWLLDENYTEGEDKVGIPMLANKQHFGYLANGMNFLHIARDGKPNWGLPELIMPSFEAIMKKSAKSFNGIDHKLFQEFCNECGILLTREGATIVYGFGESQLHVWMFRQVGDTSNLYLYFTQNLRKEIHGNSTHGLHYWMTNNSLWVIKTSDKKCTML